MQQSILLYWSAELLFFFRKAWARKGALVALVLSTFYEGTAFAWGFTRGVPTTQALFIGYGAMIAWNAVWIYLIYRKSSVDALR